MRGVVLLLALLVGACGILPEDSFTGKRAGDGIAPWTDLGPVQVCFGNQFLGPPESAPGGLCVAETTTEEPCLRDGDCRSREACVCGRCTIAFCATASDCPPGRTCSFAESRCDVACFDAGDCAGGEECFNGVCRGRCVDSDDCQTGEICNARNFCATAACSVEDDCFEGEACRIQQTPRQVLEPTLALDRAPGREIVMWVEIADELQRDQTAIWRAISLDGRHFQISPADPVVEDGLTARAPSVVRGPDGWVMYYEHNLGAGLRVVTSPDGIAWSEPQVALVGGAGPSAARSPAAVVLPGGEVAVYYQIGDGAAIGLATGALGGALEAQGVVLEPGDVQVPRVGNALPFWDAIERVASPFAAITESADGPSLRLWYAAFGAESGDALRFGDVAPIPPNYSIGYAAGTTDDATQLKAWPYGPVVDRVQVFLEHQEELAPAVLQLPGTAGLDDAYLLYYTGAAPAMDATGVDGPFVIGRLGVLGNGDYSRMTGP